VTGWWVWWLPAGTPAEQVAPARRPVRDHRVADREARALADTGGTAVVCRPDRRPVAVYTGRPRTPATPDRPTTYI
jgi:hypothetical protein